MGLQYLIEKYDSGLSFVSKAGWYVLDKNVEGVMSVFRISEHIPHMRLYDNERGMEYDTEAYELEGGIFLVYEYQCKKWLDRRGKEYKAVVSGGKVIGFTEQLQERTE